MAHRGCKAAPTVDIASLPPELLALCFAVLPAAEVGRAARVCQALRIEAMHI